MKDYRKEFPDYPEADMPPIPEGWADESWHNDACPSFKAGDFLVFVNYKDPQQRELQEGGRFFVIHHIDGPCPHDDTLLETDDWQAILDFVK